MARMIKAAGYSKTLIVSFVMLCSYSTVSTAAARESNIYVAINNFVWEEFDESGSRLLKESGILVGPGFSYWREFERSRITIKPTAELFFGTVDYNGQACDNFGNCQPATTQVDYFGFKIEGEVGRRFGSPEAIYIEPFAGLGFRYWIRDINNGTTANGSPTAGYTEGWQTFNVRLGMRAGKNFTARKEAFAQAGVKIPIYNENTAYLNSAGLGSDITMNPGRKASFFAEAGMKINRFKGSVFYDSLRFSKSDVVSDNGFIYWQPESSMDSYGFKLGWTF